jgi:hypothetical protein
MLVLTMTEYAITESRCRGPMPDAAVRPENH